MGANLTAQVRNIAQVTTAVARGDSSRKITVDVKGEILELKDTIHTMVDQLNGFASEVTRVAREVGTEGKLGGRRRLGRQHLSRGDQPDLPPVEFEMLAAFEQSNLLCRELERSNDVGEGKGVGLPGDLRQQGANDGERHRQLQLEPGPFAGQGSHAHRAVHLLDHVLHGIETYAATGHVSHGALHRKTRQEEEGEQLGFAQRAARRHAVVRFRATIGFAEPVQIDAPAVVRNDDLQGAAAVPRFDGLDQPPPPSPHR